MHDELRLELEALLPGPPITPPLPDPPPAATDPAGYREGQVVMHVKGGLYRCTRPVDAVDGQVMCYSLADGFQLWFPADMLRPIPPHPGCVVLFPQYGKFGVLSPANTTRPHDWEVSGIGYCSEYMFTVMAPAPGWQGEEATRHDA